MGIFPFEFSVHLIRSLLTVLPNFTFHDYYSTVSSIFRALFHLLHRADWHNGFSSAWIMSVNVCLYKQAVVLVLDLVHPQCDAAYMRGNLGLMLKIYIYFIINEQKYSERQLNFIYEFSDRRNLPLFKLSALLTEHSSPAFTGEVRQLSWAQHSPSRQKSCVAFNKENIAPQFAPSLMGVGNSFINGCEVKEGKEISVRCP